MVTRLCITRHGVTDWNRDQRIQGQTDVPLNASGRAQAQAMARHAADYPFTAVYSSDLGRARETARILAQPQGLAIQTLSGLRERAHGIFQGLRATEAALLYPAAHARYRRRDLDEDFETGESLRTFAARVMATLDGLVDRHPGESLCVVCHAGVLDIVYRKATGRPLETPRDFTIPNCTLNWFRVDCQGWHLDRWDEGGTTAWSET